MLRIPEVIDALHVPQIGADQVRITLRSPEARTWSTTLAIDASQRIRDLDALVRAICSRFGLRSEVWFRSRYSEHGFANECAHPTPDLLRQRAGAWSHPDLTVFETTSALTQSCVGAVVGCRYVDPTIINRFPFGPDWRCSRQPDRSLRLMPAFEKLMRGARSIRTLEATVYPSSSRLVSSRP